MDNLVPVPGFELQSDDILVGVSGHTRAMGGYYPPPPPVPSVRPGHPSTRRGVGQFNDSDGSMITFLSGSIAMSITPQRND